jgi:hypothetical protein
VAPALLCTILYGQGFCQRVPARRDQELGKQTRPHTIPSPTSEGPRLLPLGAALLAGVDKYRAWAKTGSPGYPLAFITPCLGSTRCHRTPGNMCSGNYSLVALSEIRNQVIR